MQHKTCILVCTNFASKSYSMMHAVEETKRNDLVPFTFYVKILRKLMLEGAKLYAFCILLLV